MKLNKTQPIGLVVIVILAGMALAATPTPKAGGWGFTTDSGDETPGPPGTPVMGQTPTASSVLDVSLGDTQTRAIDDMEMVFVPGGEFQMGSTDADQNAHDDEKPQHIVYLDAYWMDRYEVSNAQYRQCVVAGACQASTDQDILYNRPEQPVVTVNWSDADTYCRWAGARLPSEAEWEKAARGTDGRVYPWGNDWEDDRANTFDTGLYRPAVVGSYPEGASWIGALDMAGNVWEWVSDWYGDYPSGKQVNPTGPASGDYRVLRGGSWFDSSDGVRCASRFLRSPIYGEVNTGFRCARSS
jgi:formylglycine-generating enzyme required for sulfatase activity